jgi:chemotaxis protein CheD
MANARIGEILVSHDPGEELVALGLGSCIAIVMIDSQAQIAGLAHVMLPRSAGPTPLPGKFADTAVPELLAQLTTLGASAARLRVAIAGGAQMFAGEGMDIGTRNTQATRAALRQAGLPCHAQETGGQNGRTLRVSVATGQTTIRVRGGAPIALLEAEREA